MVQRVYMFPVQQGPSGIPCGRLYRWELGELEGLHGGRGFQLIPVSSIDFRLWVILFNARGFVMAGLLMVIGQVQVYAGWLVRAESRAV